MQLFSADATIFSKKKFKFIFCPWKHKKTGLKSFFHSTAQLPKPAQNWFFILWICPKIHLSPYLWSQWANWNWLIDRMKVNRNWSYESRLWINQFDFWVWFQSCTIKSHCLQKKFLKKVVVFCACTYTRYFSDFYSSNKIKNTQNEDLNIVCQNLNSQ